MVVAVGKINVVVTVYSFKIHEAVLKKKIESWVDVGSMWGRSGVDVFVDGKIYRITEEVEEELEGNQDWGEKILKIVEEKEIKIEEGK